MKERESVESDKSLVSETERVTSSKDNNRKFKSYSGGKVKNKMRNIPCPCGSGKKFKKCCMGKVD